MNIGLYDGDSHNYPSLPLMKISAYHKAKGDSVEWALPFIHYDKVYVSRVFGDEYTTFQDLPFSADEIIYGGTGFAISIENGKEVYRKSKDKDLPDEIEHIYPDYSLYPELTKDTAYGFLTRGCPNACGFCIVSEKEGRISHKVADLNEWWNGQRYIELLDPNCLACREREDLLRQLADSKARVNFAQGLDARFITEEVCKLLGRIKIKDIHFAYDLMRNKERIEKGLEIYAKHGKMTDHSIVYMLTNFNTTIQEDLYRVRRIAELGYKPDVRIYRKEAAPKILRDLQRWCNNRPIYKSCDFLDYVPRTDGRTIKEIYKELLWTN